MMDSKLINAVLMKYLEKCKVQNALKFFEWRRRIKEQHLDKEGQLVLNLRLKNLHHHETKLFKNTDEMMNYEFSKGEKVKKLDRTLNPKKEDTISMRGSTSLAKHFQKRVGMTAEQMGLFKNLDGNTMDELTRNAPLMFEYVPTKQIMQKLIVKATQINSPKDLE